MNIRPEVEGYWNNHIDEINSDIMEPHYQWMINKIGARRCPTLTDVIPNYTGKAIKTHRNLWQMKAFNNLNEHRHVNKPRKL